VHATGKLCRFRAGEKYRVDAFVHVSDVRAAQGDVGIWFGEDLVCKLSQQDAAAAAKGWVAISGIYHTRAANRESVRIGVNNVTGASVWFDNVRLRVDGGRANALKLTMLGCADTEVIASDGEGLRPFQQPLLIVRRRAKNTAFASVFEPYYGKPAIQAVRPLSPNAIGIEVVTERTIDRFHVSDQVRRQADPNLSLQGMVGAVSLDRATGALRWLCLGKGVHVSTPQWSMDTATPATLHLARSKRGYELRTWGEGRGRVTIHGPGISTDLTVHERLADGKVKPKVVATVTTPAEVSFEIQGGKVYELVGK